MLGIGEGELLIIVVFGFLLFGPDKLPQMGRTLGRALRQFRQTQEKMTSVVQTEVIDPMAAAANAPVKPKKQAVNTVDTDEDAETGAQAAPAPKKETFAERRARLAAEKAAREAEASGATAEVAPSADAPVSADASAQAASEASPAAPPASPAPATPAEQAVDTEPSTTADLYARRPRRRRAAAETEPEAAREDAPASAPVGDAPAGDTAQEADSGKGGER